MVVWDLMDWERQDFDREEVESLLKSNGMEVDGWCNNTPRLKNGTLIDAQRIIEGAESETSSEDAPVPKPKRRRRK